MISSMSSGNDCDIVGLSVVTVLAGGMVFCGTGSMSVCSNKAMPSSF